MWWERRTGFRVGGVGFVRLEEVYELVEDGARGGGFEGCWALFEDVLRS